MKDTFQIEASVLGALVDRPELFPEVAEELSPFDFSPEGQIIFSALKKIFSETGTVTLPALLENLNGKINPDLVRSIVEYGSLTTDVKSCISLIKKSALKRKLEVILSRSINEISQNANPEETARTLEKRICSLLAKSNYNSTIEDLLLEYDSFVSFLKQTPWPQLPFPGLQEATGGILPQTFWILGAYTSRGKTTTAIEMARHLLDQNIVIAHFPLEEGRKLTVARYLANITGIPVRTQLQETLKGKAKEAIENAKTYLSSKHLHIHDDVFRLEDIYLKARMVQVKEKKIDLIIIDYLQLVKIPFTKNLFEAMDTLAVELKEMSKKLNTTVLGISQVGREYTKQSSAIGFKGSGGLEAACDIALWIDPARDEKRFELKLKKNRLGPTAVFLMEFQNTFTSVREITNGNYRENTEVPVENFNDDDDEIVGEL